MKHTIVHNEIKKMTKEKNICRHLEIQKEEGSENWLWGPTLKM